MLDGRPSIATLRELLVAISRRHSRVAHEAEDIAQDIILSALRRGAALESEAFGLGLRSRTSTLAT
jgi:DNA-directed RNA polymerase specialized sigma24 family protein